MKREEASVIGLAHGVGLLDETDGVGLVGVGRHHHALDGLQREAINHRSPAVEKRRNFPIYDMEKRLEK